MQSKMVFKICEGIWCSSFYVKEFDVIVHKKNISLYNHIKFLPFCQGWGQFRNWNWNWYQFQFQELELKRNWIKGIGIGIDKEELKELIQFLFLIVNSFWFFAMFLAESLNQFDLKPFEYNWQEYH